MQSPYSRAKPYLAQLKSIEQQINQNQLQEAAMQLTLLAQTNAHDPRLFLLGSRLAEAARNPDGMLTAARKAHQLAPRWPVASIHLATVLASRGEAEEALLMAGQAIEQGAGPTTTTVSETELLTKAATIAHRLGRHPQALQWLRQAEQISPNSSSIRYQIGLTLTYNGDPIGAVEIFTNLLLQQPKHPALLSARLQACLSAKQLTQAISDGEALLTIEPANKEHQFYLDIARGLTPATMPASLISHLFDRFAARFEFDEPLMRKLSFDVAQMISQWHPDRKGDVLDLGCGSGLLGASLGPIEGVLVGVDLSGDMIEQAGRHHVYDRFHQVNLLDALQATPENLYHIITALDVFTYVGRLDAVIPNAYRILLADGRFVFSVETSVDGEADYTLQDNYRYAHQTNYVQRLLKEAGFVDIAMDGRVVRYEAMQPVQGFLVTARKPLPKIGKGASRRKKNDTSRQSHA